MFTIIRQLTLTICVLSGAAFAGDTVGSITGKLIDPDGKVVTEAGVADLSHISVVLKNTASEATFTGTIDSDGNFSVTNIPPGIYNIRVPIPCCLYRQYVHEGVAINAGETLRTDFRLAWGGNLGTIGDDPLKLAADMRAKTTDPTAPTPRTPDGKPDLSGVWTNIAGRGELTYSGVMVRPPIPMKPWAAEKFKSLPKRKNSCLPRNVNLYVTSYPYKFVQTPTLLVQLVEYATPTHRQIFMDGRPHPDLDEWNPAWLGHSIGYWDGDTLVVDTVGYSYDERSPAIRESVHSEQLHTIERFRRINKGSMEIEVWAEDPEAWTGPYSFKYTAGLAEGAEVMEWVCYESN